MIDVLIFKKQINTLDRSLSNLPREFKNDLLISYFEDKEMALTKNDNARLDKDRCVLLGYKSLSYIITGNPHYSSAPEEIWEEFYSDLDDIFQDYCEKQSENFEENENF